MMYAELQKNNPIKCKVAAQESHYHFCLFQLANVTHQSSQVIVMCEVDYRKKIIICLLLFGCIEDN